MEQNPRHELVAAEISAQVQRGELPKMNQAVVKAGYDPTHAMRIVKAQTFQRALWEACPYPLIAKKQKQQLMAMKREEILFPAEWTKEEVHALCKSEGWKVLWMVEDWNVAEERSNGWKATVKTPDYVTMDKALDKLYKLGGFYAAEKVEHQVSRPLEEMPEEEIDKMIAQHTLKDPVKQDEDIPNVITGQTQANIIEGEVL